MEMIFRFATVWTYGPHQPEVRFFSVVQDTAGLSEEEALVAAMLVVTDWFHGERKYAKKGPAGVRRPENITWFVPFGEPEPLEEVAA